jgi:hypothetical protein
MLPLWFDVGVRASPHFYIGGYLQYAGQGVPLTGSHFLGDERRGRLSSV